MIFEWKCLNDNIYCILQEVIILEMKIIFQRHQFFLGTVSYRILWNLEIILINECKFQDLSRLKYFSKPIIIFFFAFFRNLRCIVTIIYTKKKMSIHIILYFKGKKQRIQISRCQAHALRVKKGTYQSTSAHR